MTKDGYGGPHDDVLAGLLKAARRRWTILAVGMSLLAILFIFAGTTRTPGARKNPVTVIASRALAVAAAFMLVRIVLLTHEDGVPVFLIDAGGAAADPGGARLAAWLERLERRFELVPLPDVTAYVRDQRYIPGKGAALVIGVSDRAGLREALEALAAIKAGTRPGARGAPGASGGFSVTLLMDECLAAEMGAAGETAGLPDDVSMGLRISACGPGDAGTGLADDHSAIERIASASAKLEASTGRRPACMMLEGDEHLVLGKVAKATGVDAFFGGDGLNRFGDRENRIRLADITRVLAAPRAQGTRLSVYAAMYRGNYFPYPAWAWLDLTAPMTGPRGG